MHSLVSTIVLFSGFSLLFIDSVIGHCKIVHVASDLSSPGPRSHGFGVDIHNKYPWFMSQGGDAGADAPFYSPRIEYVSSPVHPCGQNEALGPLDMDSWISQADGLGVATTTSDGKFEAKIFQVNRDGGGECTCEFDPSSAGKSWQRCKTLVHPPGIEGMWPADRVNHTAVFQMPSNTVCRNGVFKDKCLVRIRCGWKLRFGGCFAIKTPGSPPKLQLKVVESPSQRMSSSKDFVSQMAQKVFDTMQSKGALVPIKHRQKRSSVHHSAHPRAQPMTEESGSVTSAQTDAISLKVIELIRAHHMELSTKKASQVIKQFESRVDQS